MKEYVTEDKSPKRRYEPGAVTDRFESVEFSINGLECLHQFRIWNIRPESMCVLVKENSEILGVLSVGDILPLKYYSADNFCHTIYLDTEIRYIQKQEAGRFKGHYLIGLTILGQQTRTKIH